MNDYGHSQTDKILLQAERDAKKLYEEAYRKIRVEMLTAYQKIESLPSDASVQQRMNAWMKYDRLYKLEEQLTDILKIANKESMATLGTLFDEVYGLNYNFGAYMIETATGELGVYPTLSSKAIDVVVNDEFTPFGKLAIDEIKDSALIKQKLTRDLVSSITLGESSQKIASRMNKTVFSDYKRAVKVARTETTRIESAGRFDAYKYGQDKLGIKQNKEWVSTMDNDVRDSHKRLDGKIVALEEYFKIGSDEALYPGDFSEAKNNVNCRCTTVPHIVGFKGKATRMTYTEWEKTRA